MIDFSFPNELSEDNFGNYPNFSPIIENTDHFPDDFIEINFRDSFERINMEEKRIYAPNVVAVVNGEPTKMEDGISDKLTDPYMELTDEIKKDIYGKFKCVFKCLEEAETVCTTKAC